jgi:hypothetical protein
MNERSKKPVLAGNESQVPADEPKLSRLAAAGKNRPKRTPMGQRNRLRFRMDPNYHYHLFNDVKGGMRIQDALAAGYDFVKVDDRTGVHASEGVARAEESSQMGANVTHPVGDGVTGYLMRIPKELWLEDRAVRDQEVNEGEKGMHRNENRNPDAQGQYGGVQIADVARQGS